MKNLIGKKLDGRYELRSLIGVGGMADVYRAYDILDGCYVAIKILKEKFSGNKEFLYRFRNESKANASLSHPNIVRIFDVGFGDKIQYIVMEYIAGVTLKEYIKRAHILKWIDVVPLTLQILRGLQHAHDRGIVHRDIKPQNIMLLEDKTVKIMDFGIARFPRDEKVTFKKAIGSVHYMSPEQAIGGITDFKSDIYSVGIMMYEMLTGCLPFEGETPEIVAQKHIKGRVKSPLEINPSLPRGLVDIVLRAIKKNPQERYQSAEEMLRDIDEFKQNPNSVFEYSYLDDIDSTKYFAVPEDRGMISNNDPRYKNFANVVNEKTKNKKGKAVPILVGVAGGFFLLAIVMILTFIFARGRKSVEDIEIPNFVGMNIEEVKTIENGKYKDLGYRVIYEPSSKYSPNTIVSQSPKSGTMVKSNYSNLSFIVSSGVEKKSIPNVVGLPISKAEEKLKKLGFVNIKKVEKASENAAPGAVISIDPKVLTETAYDTPITLYYKPNEENLDVPNVVGKSLQEAEMILKDCGFEVSVKKVFDAEKPNSVVIAQNKTKAALGATIELVFNTPENKQQKKFEMNENEDFKLFEKYQNAAKEMQNKPKKTAIEVPIESKIKTKDSFRVYVVDSQKNILAEKSYKTGYKDVIVFNPDISKSAQYKVMIRNENTNNVTQYGIIEINANEKKCSQDLNPFAFSKISSHEENNFFS